MPVLIYFSIQVKHPTLLASLDSVDFVLEDPESIACFD